MCNLADSHECLAGESLSLQDIFEQLADGIAIFEVELVVVADLALAV